MASQCHHVLWPRSLVATLAMAAPQASKEVNLSEDVFAAYKTCSQGGRTTFKEYHQLGKGRMTNLNEIHGFFAKLAQVHGMCMACACAGAVHGACASCLRPTLQPAFSLPAACLQPARSLPAACIHCTGGSAHLSLHTRCGHAARTLHARCTHAAYTLRARCVYRGRRAS